MLLLMHGCAVARALPLHAVTQQEPQPHSRRWSSPAPCLLPVGPLTQLVSTDPQCREWTTDASAVHLAAICGSGAQVWRVGQEGRRLGPAACCQAGPALMLRLADARLCRRHAPRPACCAAAHADGAGQRRGAALCAGAGSQQVVPAVSARQPAQGRMQLLLWGTCSRRMQCIGGCVAPTAAGAGTHAAARQT